MFKHLKFIDGTSDKFWEIQTDGLTHVVTYGRNGTAGQSKSKSFSTEEACLKDAEKLITEKQKKGYSEDGTVVEKKDAVPAKKSATSISKEEVLLKLKDLIRSGQVADIIPFLEAHGKGHMLLIKKEIRAAKRYWVDYTDLSKDPEFRKKVRGSWGMRGSDLQQRMVKLLALATFNASDVGNWNLVVDVVREVEKAEVCAILDYAKPEWLTSYLLQRVQLNTWESVSYPKLRLAEQKGYIQFEPELFAQAVGSYRHISKEEEIAELLADEVWVTRDVPLLFDYETDINNISYHYDYKTQVHELTWNKLFDALLQAGKIDKLYILEQALALQTKNWNNNLKSYFRKLIERIGLEEAQIIQKQDLFFPLLHAEQSAVVNFVVDSLKHYCVHPEFQVASFLTWTEGLFMRNDIKTSLKTLLIQFDKLMKMYPDLQEQMILQIADVYLLTDLSLQERATKLILKYPLASKEQLSEKLQLYSSQMLGGTAAALKPLLMPASYSEEAILEVLQVTPSEKYQLQVPTVAKLQQALVYPSTWHELLFKIGEVLGTYDVLQIEVLMNSFVVQKSIFPADFQEQLAPYIDQIGKIYIYSNCFDGLFKMLYSLRFSPNHIDKISENSGTSSKWGTLVAEQVQLLQRHFAQDIALPLLSLPTHAPFWIAPQILVERILAYQEQAVTVDLLDLSIALSRTVREELAGVEALTEQIADPQVKAVVCYALGFTDTLAVEEKKSWFSSLLAKKDNQQEEWLGLWANVARTHAPDASFPALESLKDLPFAMEPFRQALKLTPTYAKDYNHRIGKSETVYDGEKLAYDLPSFKKGPSTFIYHKDIYHRGKDAYYLCHVSEYDIPYYQSLMPQNTESLSLFLTIALFAKSDLGEKGAKKYLEGMLYDFFVFEQQAVVFLATALFSNEKEVRAMAAEVLIQSIASQRLPAAALGKCVGILLSPAYGPVGRLDDVLGQCRDISSLHQQAFIQFIDQLLLNFTIGEKLPTSFKKIMEYYYDLVLKEQYSISSEVQVVLGNLMVFKPLQAILKKLIK